jgi:acyl dehydratase
VPRLYFEDFAPGSIAEFGPRSVTREEIIAFAAEFDPQPFHLDEDAARASMLGGLAASGWHTCSILMRMIYDGFLFESASMGSPGVDEVRWLAPVRPGDTLTIRRTVLDARVSRSKPDRGFVTLQFEVFNQASRRVMTLRTPMMIARRVLEHDPAAA